MHIVMYNDWCLSMVFWVAAMGMMETGLLSRHLPVVERLTEDYHYKTKAYNETEENKNQ